MFSQGKFTESYCADARDGFLEVFSQVALVRYFELPINPRIPSRHTTSFQHPQDVYTTPPTSYRRLLDVETTSCVYWVFLVLLVTHNIYAFQTLERHRVSTGQFKLKQYLKNQRQMLPQTGRLECRYISTAFNPFNRFHVEKWPNIL